ncbi:hypothetical protein [Paenibacillus tyrfis]|uniref:hypothetical protein n=1 Tax=Paenibacillus tyrfis TaxID=1501230 RepID=UPI00117BF6B0|nr:hypothetical protein [Paenibacillus tyrfis]
MPIRSRFPPLPKRGIVEHGHVDLHFRRRGENELNLKFGYRKRTDMEPDLVEPQHSFARRIISYLYTLHGGRYAGHLKVLIDRAFLPGLAYKYRQDSNAADKLLTCKSACLIVTTDTSPWYNKLDYKNAEYNVIKRSTLKFGSIFVNC